jgi:hypothetical protein
VYLSTPVPFPNAEEFPKISETVMDQLVVFNLTSSEEIFGCINLASSPIPVPCWYNYIYSHIYWIISATLLEGYYLLVLHSFIRK